MPFLLGFEGGFDGRAILNSLLFNLFLFGGGSGGFHNRSLSFERGDRGGRACFFGAATCHKQANPAKGNRQPQKPVSPGSIRICE